MTKQAAGPMARSALQAINSHLPTAGGSTGRSEQRAQGGAGAVGTSEDAAGTEIGFSAGGVTEGADPEGGANPARSADGRFSSGEDGVCVVPWDISAIRLRGKGAAAQEATRSKSHRVSRQPCRRAEAESSEEKTPSWESGPSFEISRLATVRSRANQAEGARTQTRLGLPRTPGPRLLRGVAPCPGALRRQTSRVMLAPRRDVVRGAVLATTAARTPVQWNSAFRSAASSQRARGANDE